jgi:hypothetical protein
VKEAGQARIQADVAAANAEAASVATAAAVAAEAEASAQQEAAAKLAAAKDKRAKAALAEYNAKQGMPPQADI